ncbi:MFS transporter [Secundilactobacillus paracollinoides]|uniref:MFS transporter n=1 Tax=Secundilactobacillus paracollinoides TaxID=240427 RepID=A0A1B2IW51_9LACO|nr:MFS transporter [Secundilactobacillus paracollinoides]ANZ60423.1 MFS transporter [Secundilactobacillus paracollinoides]ANZ65293.1 MFS transporter [Secundilactobacillus paracollinoides]ANZ66251.1 MFS transporter [Secundilactobacillus paracollinoides]
MKNKYVPTSISLYMNYLVVGMAILILPQNMDTLAKQWNTSIAGVSVVISAVGIGRLIVMLVSGVLSDKLGRKPFAVVGGATYILFFLGILISHSLIVAIIFGVLAGIANSFLDAGTYPALMEMYPTHKGAANVVIKAFVSGGQFILPLFISMIVANKLWYGWSFLLCAAILILNVVFLLTLSKFPAASQGSSKKEETAAPVKPQKSKGNVWIDGTLFTIFSFVAQGIFLLFSTWITKYGEAIVKMGDVSSRALVSYYSIGSITCVLLTIYLSHRGVQDIHFLFVYMMMSFASLLLMYLIPVAWVCSILSFVVGFSAAGGVMQIGLTMMATFFPNGKGTVTGVSQTSASIAGFVVPLFGGALSGNIANVLLFDVVLALIGFVVAGAIMYRYRKLFGRHKKAPKAQLEVASQNTN